MRPRVLVLDPDTPSRLQVVSLLREDFQVLAHDTSQPVLRQVRSEQPALVLVVLGRRRDAHVLRTCQMIRTDARPPRMGIVDPWARPWSEGLVELECEGRWTGQPDTDLAAWARAILEGHQPVEKRAPRQGLLGKLLGRGPT